MTRAAGPSRGAPRVRAQTAGEFRKYVKYKGLVFLFLPGIIYYLVFHYAPMYGVIIAFKDYKFSLGILGSHWVGWEHFDRMFRTESFLFALRNTFLISMYKLVFGFPAPIVLALLLNEVVHERFKKTIQTISYLPHFVSWVILAGLFTQILSPSQGIVNFAIRQLGGKPVYFLADPRWFRSVLVATSIFQQIGWGSIIYIATLAGVNPEYYEAARMDGANRWQQAIHVTLPALTPVITIMLILAIGRLVNDEFDQIFNLYNPAVYSVGDVIQTYTYRAGLVDMNYSYAAAVGLFKNLFALVLIVGANGVTKRINEYGIW